MKFFSKVMANIRKPKHADGFMGKNTRNAVRGYQKHNGLFVDGNIGGPNSATRIKLGVR